MTRVRTGLPFGAVAAVVAFAAVAFLVSIVLAYFKWVHHDRRAAYHLPPDTIAAARVDVGQAVLYEPVRKHLLPILADLTETGPEVSFEAFEAQTGLERSDLREIVVGLGPTRSDWVLALGGLFPKDALNALGHFLLSENPKGWQRAAGGDLRHVSGVVVGQAEDGILIVADSHERLARALPTQQTHSTLGLRTEGPASLAVGALGVRQATQTLVAWDPTPLRPLEHVSRVAGRLEVGTDAELELVLTPIPGRQAERLALEMAGVLATLRRLSAEMPGPDFAGERAVLQRATVSVTEAGSVRILLDWKRGEMLRGAESLGAALRRWVDEVASR